MNPLQLIGWLLLAGLAVLIPVIFIEAIRLLHGWVNAKRRLWDAEATWATRLGNADGGPTRAK